MTSEIICENAYLKLNLEKLNDKEVYMLKVILEDFLINNDSLLLNNFSKELLKDINFYFRKYLSFEKVAGEKNLELYKKEIRR